MAPNGSRHGYVSVQGSGPSAKTFRCGTEGLNDDAYRESQLHVPYARTSQNAGVFDG